ncbi:L-fucose permease Glucose/galactose transporter [Gaeumannomyces tritici R3-111a-1]|uniref:L-fucose permease Glucose/galactose transporter n=1 Tax=Gaeumannomyces tritici (strain R3-111a-1) TaxID=644352 RepID=J3NWU7_GAET3|nr:L-fucose permease Glucose/galactose transporter [Gaeumannomyces tritici R3-111a-1]EJT75829.1 L-fucose permease Glucose/galactose transporter [Gaeumannomyces tritici R3-111a-1]
MTGLAVLAVGCLLFWPSGLRQSYGGYCGSMFVVGAGLATLETAADPFLSICGPPRYSEVRLNLAQAIQGVGSFVAPLLASRVFFANTIDTNEGLKNVQWVYLGVAGFVALLIVLFFLAPMPEITDADMNAQEGEMGRADPGPFRKQYNLFLAIWSQFCYVGAQVAVAFCVEAGRDKAQGSDLLALGQGLYALNRFLAGLLMTIPAVRPRYILALYLGLCFVFVTAAINTAGTVSIAMLILVLCFESACFATIFTLGLRGLGRHTKIGGSLLVAAISGGMVFPPMTGALMDARGAHIAMVIPMMGYILAWMWVSSLQPLISAPLFSFQADESSTSYPLYVNVWNREVMDAHRDTTYSIEPSASESHKMESQVSHGGNGNRDTVADSKLDVGGADAR